MTSQLKKFIEVWDIIGIQMQCKKCSASLLVGGDTLRTISDAHNDTLWKCPTCNHPWTVQETYPQQMGYDNEVKKFIRLIEQMRAIGDKLGFHLRFEIKDEGGDKK